MEVHPLLFMLGSAFVIMRFIPVVAIALFLCIKLRGKHIKLGSQRFKTIDICYTFCGLANVILYGIVNSWWTLNLFGTSFFDTLSEPFLLLSIIYLWIIWITSVICVIANLSKALYLPEKKLLYFRYAQWLFVADVLSLIHFVPLIILIIV